MRVSFIAALLAASAVSTSAFQISKRQGPPACSIPCFDPSLSSGTCPEGDNGCLCRDTAFVSAAIACLNRSCSGDDLATANEVANALCQAAGVTLTGAPTPSATAPPAASSAAPSAAATGGAASSPSPSPSTGAAMSNAVPLAGLAGAVAAVLAL